MLSLASAPSLPRVSPGSLHIHRSLRSTVCLLAWSLQAPHYWAVCGKGRRVRGVTATLCLFEFLFVRNGKGATATTPPSQDVHAVRVPAALLPKWHRKQKKDSEEPWTTGVPQSKEGGMPRAARGMACVDGSLLHFPLRLAPSFARCPPPRAHRVHRLQMVVTP